MKPSFTTAFSAFVLVSCAAIFTGCASEDPLAGADPGSSVVVAPSGPCTAGESRECGITLARQGDVVSCFEGKQLCVDGSWSACTDGEVKDRPVPRIWLSRRGGASTLAYSTPVACVSNPCDPRCQVYKEDPPDLTPTGGGTPVDPGVPDWSSPPGTATCSHALCSTGAALDATCHPCVAKVCAADATCCSASWTAACVNLVYSECSGTAPPVGLGMCDFAAFADGHIRVGNGGTGNPVIGAKGSSTVSGYAVYPETNCRLGGIYTQGGANIRNGCVVTGKVTTQLGVYAEAASQIIGDVKAGTSVELRNGVKVTGSVEATTSIWQEGGEVTGNAWAGTGITLNATSKIGGNAQSVGNMNGQVGSSILGSATVNSPSSISSNLTVSGTKNTAGSVGVPLAPVVTLPDLNAYRRNIAASCAVANARPNIDAMSSDRTLPPGVYGAVTVYSSYKLILQAGGSYVFKSIRFFAGSTGLRLAGTAPWDISVCGSYTTDNGIVAYLNGTSTKPNPQDFIVYSAATSGDGISIGDNNVFDGMFIAPDSQIRIYNNYTGTSAFWGKTVWTDTQMKLTNIPKAACEARNPYGTAICDGTTPQYADGKTYATNDVVHHKGKKYKCTVGGWCTTGAGYGGGVGYWPGEGLFWSSAWSYLGDCPPPPTPPAAGGGGGSCPVSLTIPGTPKPKTEPCYSGLDCQVNSRCTEVKTGLTCNHSKCVTGAALSAGCDSCVARVCAASPSCCSSSWDASCVARVATDCDADCGATTAVGCAHDMCATGSALNAACSSNVASVCSSPGFAYCCSTNWDSACISKLYLIVTGSAGGPAPAPGTSRCDYAVMGSGALAGYANVVVGGDVGGGTGANAFYYDWGVAPSFSGNIYSQGSMYLYQVSVAGAAKATGAMSVVGGSIGSPPAQGGVAVPSAAIPTKTFTCPTGGSNVTAGSSTTLAPGTYGNVVVNGGVILDLQAGTYRMQSLTVNGEVRLPATGTTIVDVCGNVAFKSWGDSVAGLVAGGDALRFQVYSASSSTSSGTCTSNAICIPDGAVVDGVFTAPNGGAYVGQDATLQGWVQAAQANLRHRSTINANGSTGAACRSAGLDPVNPPLGPCPVTTPLTSTVAEGGTCVNNAAGFTVSGARCAQADLAVGMSCTDDTVPVCNHGNTTVPAGEAELVFYPKAANQFATLTPDALWQAGTCTVASAIAPGACVEQACAASLTDEDLTVRVRLKSTATVTECSTLDNWSYYDEARGCTPAGATSLEEVQTYEAVCPTGQSPVWVFLTWVATAPGASTITFEGRTDLDGVFDASSDPYVPLEIARSTPIDTQNCSLASGLAECPVPLTTRLFGAAGRGSQPRFLQLKATLNASGGSQPTLKSWNVSYSCVDSQ